ncbi:M56 family metallopeptidase [Paludisphaera borealis]|uniref:Peptidase M56 domain-containing protein n=1 Tax=Paludisphaera borealis TaxID=1387353 RepID=A0A1U7CKS8_9BACT|nr:M56 family metallopeptidase [Paludisphaera borealis]APW59544.1 hypothetical protein BSF38_00968 [Paludisphaera borealis]
MWPVLDLLSRTLIDAGIANAILLSLVVVLMVFTRQPSRRIMLAQTGFYSALLMLPLVVFTPLPRLYPLDWMVRNGVMPPQMLPRSSQFATDDLLGRRFRARLDDVGHGTHSDAEWPAGEPLIRALTLVHLGGATIGIGWFGLGLWGFRRLLRRSNEPSDATRRIFDELIADLGRPPPYPKLRVSAWPRGPVLGGLVQPCILIPERLDDDDVDPNSLRLILLHELAHADRSDVWFSALASVSQAVWFFLPHLWWLRSQLRIDQEFLADRKAAGPIGDSTAYAQWLVGLASVRSAGEASAKKTQDAAGDPQFPWWKGGFKSPLLQRVAMLLYCPFRVEDHPPPWFSIVMPALLMAIAIAVSCFRLLAPLDPSALLHPARPSDPLVSSLNIPQFVLVPGRPPAVLPLALPPSFQLTADLLATSTALAQIRLSDHPLTALGESGLDPSALDPNEPPSWHRIYMCRNLNGLTLLVDGVPVPVDDPYDEEPDSPQWLTLAPPRDTTAILRDLVVTW